MPYIGKILILVAFSLSLMGCLVDDEAPMPTLLDDGELMETQENSEFPTGGTPDSDLGTYGATVEVPSAPAAVANLDASAVLVPTSTVQADDHCPGWADVEIGGGHYPVTLHNTTVYLCHDRLFTNAYARAYLRNGDILSVDKSKNEVTGKEWWQTFEIVQRGGWYYWETTSSGGWTETTEVDNYKNAVRVCLRRNGALQCANWWFADQDL